MTLVRNARNQVAGTNRNQIIGHVDDDTTLHFIDADMYLATTDTAAVARELASRCAAMVAGVIGGLMPRLDGFQEPHDFGPVFS
ncbi:MAG: hypothetical protein ACSLFA_02115 [Mycobacterium sp.]